MKKNLFLRLCLMMTVVLSFCSCRQDILPEQETYHNTSAFQLTSKRISLNEAKHKAKLTAELSKAKDEFKAFAEKNIQGKTVNFGDSISVNTDEVIYMENGPNYHTYTFSIRRSNPLPNTPVENLVFTPLPNGGYKAYLVTYNFSEAEKNIILNGGYVSVSGKSSVTPIEGVFASVMSVDNCTMQINDYYTWCGEGKHNDGKPCEAPGGVYSQHIVTMTMVCQGGLPPQPGIEGSIDGGPDGGGGSSSATPCSANGVYLQPQDPANSDCNAGVVTQPILEFNPPQTPCQKIKEQRNDEGFKKRMDTLKGKTGLTKETGYIQKWGGSYEYKDNASATSTANTLSLPEVVSNTWIRAFMHTHIDDIPNSGNKGIKMFSPADAAYFMDLVQNAQTKGESLSDPYAVMVTSTGNYQIRFTGNQYQIKTFTKVEKDSHNDPFGIFMADFMINSKKLELGFLKYIQKEMLLYGITLYRMNTDGTATEIKLNADKTDTIENTCP